MADTSPKGLARQLLAILYKDRPRLMRIDAYAHGHHDLPYMPDHADAEYRMLAERAVSNWMPLVEATPAQALYVDGFRRPDATITDTGSQQSTPEWDHWQISRLDARQIAVHRGALRYGHAFTSTLKDAKGRIVTKGLSALRTAALYEDPANDDTPYAALHVTSWPSGDRKGTATLWDGIFEYPVVFASFALDADKAQVTVGEGVRHGASECPITRFAASVDLDGRTIGVVEPLIRLQNRINQTVFDLLVAQTGGSFKVRWATGMAPPLLTEPVYEDPDDPNSEIVGQKLKLDDNGQPIPKPVNLNAKRFMFAEDENVKFGTLDETPLDGYISSIDMSIRHLSAIAQVPPHHLLGQIANLSAEALQAAETSLLRKIEEFRKAFGESWERVFRLAADLSGVPMGDDDYKGEVLWRDMEQKSMAQAADALGKLGDQLGIPKQGLWPRVPGVTQGELSQWQKLAAEQPDAQMAEALSRATTTTIPRQVSDDVAGAA